MNSASQIQKSTFPFPSTFINLSTVNNVALPFQELNGTSREALELKKIHRITEFLCFFGWICHVMSCHVVRLIFNFFLRFLSFVYIFYFKKTPFPFEE